MDLRCGSARVVSGLPASPGSPDTRSKLLVHNITLHVSDRFPIRNGLKQGDALSPLFYYLL